MIVIVDYQMGNLRSVQKALERLGHAALVTDRAEQVATAERIILPGVGAFEDAMQALGERDLVEPIRDAAAAGRPLLGICLGMQLLFERSYEDGEHEGLGLFQGEVVRFELPRQFKVPHMGWNQVDPAGTTPLLDEIPAGSHFYFVHSYYVAPSEVTDIAATTDYGGAFCSVVARDNLFATQFHPEKSQHHGQLILRNFVERCGAA
ncbi:MAG: imidazole glycerol phosphate synthase subunit HisH [Planctomycetota bacterium]|nr:MAG: imidazole glycerol phosphate synthase subunit HisH [Planctomycetota bacterium]REJ87605.1 MAG: imidazole glycerol phosphate synthase subunit HisH [Planctomycetota bacterium]REK30155.1 MAG: imidazole glycerol phosphate synthase subunit HisH [Planctomycetota bacterium]REK43318.1 MAG: imidazole glycerol phosphate synthase subunit HisH [Planctomycetota bacterium]